MLKIKIKFVSGGVLFNHNYQRKLRLGSTNSMQKIKFDLNFISFLTKW
jgi:hypothetical protein